MGTHDLRIRLAQIAAQEGRMQEAAQLYAQVLRGNPYLLEAWQGLSQVLTDHAQLAYCQERIRALSPLHAEANARILEKLADQPADTNDGDWPVDKTVLHWPHSRAN